MTSAGTHKRGTNGESPQRHALCHRVLGYSEADVLAALDGAMPTCCPAAALQAMRAAVAPGLPQAQLKVCVLWEKGRVIVPESTSCQSQSAAHVAQLSDVVCNRTLYVACIVEGHLA